MKNIYQFLLVAVFLFSCASPATSAITPTATPVATQTPTVAPTNTPTITPTKMPEAISPQNASQLVHYAVLGHGFVQNAVTSPDHKTIAVASTIGVVLYDTQTLKKIKIIETTGRVESVSFSPDGTKLAIGLSIRGGSVVDNTLIGTWATAVEIWNVQTNTKLNRLDDIEGSVFSPDGCQLFNWDENVHNICDNTVSEKSAKDWRNPSAVISPDGTKALVYVPLDGWALWDTQKNIKLSNINIKASLDFQGDKYSGGLPIYSPDGKTIASFQADQIYLLDGTEIRPIAQYKINSVIRSLYYSPDSKLLLAADMDNILHLLSVTTGEQLGESEALPYLPMAVAFSPDSQFVTTLDDYVNIFKWKIPELKLERTEVDLPLRSPGIFSNDGNYLAIASYGANYEAGNFYPPKIVVFDATTLEQTHLLDVGHDPDSYVGGLAFSPDGKELAATDGFAGIVNVWEMATGKLSRTLEIAPGSRFREYYGLLDGVAYSPDGKIIAAVNLYKNRLYLWDAISGKLLDSYGLPFWKGQQLHPAAIYFNQDGSQVIINTASVWDLKKKEWTDDVITSEYANPSKTLYVYNNGCIKNNDWKYLPDEFCLSTSKDSGNTAKGEKFTGKSYPGFSTNFMFNPRGTSLLQVSSAGVAILWHIEP